MATKLPQQNRAIRTRDRILQQAAQLFAVRGYHDTSLSDIRQAAGVTTGALFHHFDGKQEIGLAVIASHMERRRKELDAIERRLGPVSDDQPLGAVYRRLDAVRNMVRRRRNNKGGCIIGNLSTSLSDTDPVFRKRLSECFDEMALEFRVHLDEAAARCGPPVRTGTWDLARYIVSVIEGAIMLARTHRNLELIDRQFEHLKEDLRRTFEP